jgi:hypothetical protein
MQKVAVILTFIENGYFFLSLKLIQILLKSALKFSLLEKF